MFNRGGVNKNKVMVSIKYLFFFCVCIVFFVCSFAFAEDITIVTYYPAPYGVYKELRTDELSVGPSYRALAIPTNGLIIEGRTGIGTSSVATYGGKQAELDVNGEIAASDVYLKDVGYWLSSASWCLTSTYTTNSGTVECPAGTTYTWVGGVLNVIPTSGSYLCCK